MRPSVAPATGDAPSEEDLRAIGMATDAVAALEKALRARQTYPATHPAVAQLEQRAFAAIDRHLREEGRLELHLSPFAVICRGQPVYEAADKSQRGWFYFAFTDGIYVLGLLPGLDADELRALVEVLAARLADPEAPEEDLVTRLWAKQLPHVIPAIGDSFLDVMTSDRPEEVERRQESTKSILGAARGRVRVVPRQAQAHPQKAERLSLSELEALEQVVSFWAFEIDPGKLQEIARGSHEADRDLDARYAEILYRSAAGNPAATEGLGDLFSRLVSSGDFEGAAHALIALRGVPEASPGLLEQLRVGLAGPARMTEILAVFERRLEVGLEQGADREAHELEVAQAVAALLRELPLEAGAAVLARFQTLEQGAVRGAYAQLLSLLAETSQFQDAIAARLADAEASFALALIDVLSSAGAIASALPALAHADARVRRHVAELASALPIPESGPALLRVLEDPDRAVRGRVWSRLSEASLEECPRLPSRLRAALSGKSSDSWSDDELRVAMEWLGRLCGESVVPELEEALRGEGQLARPRGRRTGAVIAALRATGAPQAVDALLREGKRHFRWKNVSRACRQAARDMIVTQGDEP